MQACSHLVSGHCNAHRSTHDALMLGCPSLPPSMCSTRALHLPACIYATPVCFGTGTKYLWWSSESVMLASLTCLVSLFVHNTWLPCPALPCPYNSMYMREIFISSNTSFILLQTWWWQYWGGEWQNVKTLVLNHWPCLQLAARFYRTERMCM